MISYPIEFHSTTKSESGLASIWSSDSGGRQNAVAVPPEFEGPGGGLSPEDLYNQALANCFVATFKVYCHHSRVTFDHLSVATRLVVDLDENKKPVMKDFYLSAKVTGASSKDRVLMLAQRAAKSGFILNSVKTQCHFDFSVHE